METPVLEPKNIEAMLRNSSTLVQEKSDSLPLDPAWMKYGLPLVLLFLLLGVLWKLTRWIEPKANAVIDGILQNANRTPGLLEAQAARDVADAARTEALMAAVRALNTLAEQLAQRVGAQSERTQLIATHSMQNGEHLLRLIEAVGKNTELLTRLVADQTRKD